MRRLHDDCGRELHLPGEPQRIVSLCPSLTETLFSLGAGQRVVGRTRYCVHPQPAIAGVPTCGGTKNPDLEAIAALWPDLVIAEKEENRREDVEALAGRVPVYVCDIESWEAALATCAQLGVLLGQAEDGRALAGQIERAWQGLPVPARPLRVLYLIWRRPWMAAGSSTYIDAVLRRCGLINAAASLEGRYPVLGEKELAALDIDLCLLSSEPYPFAARHLKEVRALLPDAHVERVDGEMFSWYGARMLPAAAYLADCLRHWNEIPA